MPDELNVLRAGRPQRARSLDAIGRVYVAAPSPKLCVKARKAGLRAVLTSNFYRFEEMYQVR